MKFRIWEGVLRNQKDFGLRKADFCFAREKFELKYRSERNTGKRQESTGKKQEVTASINSEKIDLIGKVQEGRNIDSSE